MEFIIRKPEELNELVPRLLEFAGGRLKFLLEGNLGAGKTTFVKAFCDYFNVKENVSSPTFSIINEYLFTDGKGDEKVMAHIDLYRLKNIEEALDIGIEDYLYNNSYCLIEWPGLIESLAPEEAVRIKFEILPDSSRKILFL